MKKGVGAQLASAEGGELKGMYKIAAKEYVKKFHGNKSKEERQKIEKEITNDAERLSAIGRLQKTAGEASDPEKQKQSLKNVSDKLLDKYPQFERLLSQVATSGKGKFKGDEGTAGLVLTGKTKSKEATAKPSEQQKSARPRLALPKGSNRPGNLKIDYRPEEPVSRQSSFSDFSKQTSQAQKSLDDAEKAQAAARVITKPDGTPVPRKNAFYLQNNPGAAQQHAAKQEVAAQAVNTARSTLDTLSQRAAQARVAQERKPERKPETRSEPKPTQPQRTQPVDTKPQQQPTTSQPETLDQRKRKKERTETDRRDTMRRMDAAGQRLGVQ
jgi:hypothetical protein